MREHLPQSRPGPGAPRPGSAPDLRVLFLGSSLTYNNDLPLLVQAFARAVGKNVEVATVAKGGFSFEDHCKRGAALSTLRKNAWNYVVMQQGPSTLPASRRNMREWARRLVEPIRQAGARPALYMVWPGEDRLAYFDEVRISYQLTAEDIDGMMIPAGEAWRAAWRRDPDIPLYRRDREHPSPTGSFLVALSIFGMLLSRSPVGLPARVQLPNGAVAQVPPPLATLLQESAGEANQAYGRR
ncbi:MAG TPA: SGNH/GDSL hydrolase family protein [Thermoanaerobaculia bacterium]|nr:SGNH/GDSL hydrolase family protein [Thermoanaerobaculia bacterium]